MDIEEMYVKGILPDSHGIIDLLENVKRKPLVQNDLKPLYRMHSKDIDNLAQLVEAKKVCMKSSVVRRGDESATMITLMVAGQHEKFIRVMKNKFMCHFQNHELPSWKSIYFPYLKESYDSFAESMNISQTEVEYWVDKALASTVGKKWLDNRTKGLNKTSDPNDYPLWIRNMSSSHIYATGESIVIENLKTTFAQLWTLPKATSMMFFRNLKFKSGGARESGTCISSFFSTWRRIRLSAKNS